MPRPEATGCKIGDGRPEKDGCPKRHGDRGNSDGPTYDRRIEILPYAFDCEQAAAFLNVSVSHLYICLAEKSKIRKQRNLPFIPSYMPMGKRLIKRSECEALFAGDPTPLKSFISPPRKRAV
jgi:hypothetical protein